MSPELLASMAGVLLSLAMSYVPGLSTAYERLSTTGKRVVMAGLLLVTALGSAAWACQDPGTTDAFQVCLGGTNWRAYITAFIAALVANQATHQITPTPKQTETPSSRL